MSKPKQYSIYFKSNIIKEVYEVYEGLLSNQELYKDTIYIDNL